MLMAVKETCPHANQPKRQQRTGMQTFRALPTDIAAAAATAIDMMQRSDTQGPSTQVAGEPAAHAIEAPDVVVKRKQEAANDPPSDSVQVANRRLRKTMAPRLVYARELAGYRQSDAAKTLGFSTPCQLNQWERGVRTVPIQDLCRVAEVYGVSPGFLLGATNEPDHDPARGLRAASVAAVRRLLTSVSERMIDEVSRQATLIGPDAKLIRSISTAGNALIDAIEALHRLNVDAFQDMRGSATVLRCCNELSALVINARADLARFDALDQQLGTVMNFGEAADVKGDDGEVDE
jgi:transcriptional regulator with XRE-family HTH domain